MLNAHAPSLSLFDAVNLLPASRERGPRAKRVTREMPKFKRAGFLDLLREPHLLVAAWWTGFFRIARHRFFELVLGREMVDVRPFVLEAAGAWTFTNNTRTFLLNGTFDIDSDSFKMALFLSTSNIGASTTTYAGVTNEVANANGYTTGGIAQTLTLSGTTTVTVATSSNPVWTASGGSITARFAVIYEVSGNVLCYCLLDSTPADVTATDGNTLTVQINGSGIFTLA